jgi:hypothetical protein
MYFSLPSIARYQKIEQRDLKHPPTLNETAIHQDAEEKPSNGFIVNVSGS